jgi:hypothetical protein
MVSKLRLHWSFMVLLCGGSFSKGSDIVKSSSDTFYGFFEIRSNIRSETEHRFEQRGIPTEAKRYPRFATSTYPDRTLLRKYPTQWFQVMARDPASLFTEYVGSVEPMQSL